MKINNKKSTLFKKNFVTGSTLFHRILIGLICFIFALLITFNGAIPVKYDIRTGDVSSIDVFAPRDIEDKITSNRMRDAAENGVTQQYDIDEDATTRSESKISNFLKEVLAVQQLNDLDQKGKVQKLMEYQEIQLPSENYPIFLQKNSNELKQLGEVSSNILKKVMEKGIEQQNYSQALDLVEETVRESTLSKDLKGLANTIIDKALEVNKHLNIERTTLLKMEVRKSVEPRMYKKGEKIVGKGEKIKEEQIGVLNELGLIQNENRFDLRFLAGIFFVMLLSFISVIVFLYLFNKKIFHDRSDLILISLIFLSILAGALFSLRTDSINIYLVPVSAACMLISILLDVKLAIMVNVILSILIGLMTKGNANFIYVTLLSGTLSGFAVNKAQQRNQLVAAGLLMGLVNAVLIVSFGLLNSNDLHNILIQGLYGIINGVFSIILTIGTLPFLEATFNIITPLKLLELSNPNQPLVKRLLLEAPGTYHHSLLVGNLAEAATEAIGGNALLARVAAYYHDIGKLKRPFFFKENQYHDNPHDRMTADLSTMVITSHTNDGVEIGKAYKLPQAICDIIQQHHGTTLVAYFYHKATNGDQVELVNPEDFRYEGPRPQTKEAAVVMLADCVEAVVRAIPDRTEDKIEKRVKSIIRDKLNDGQLDLSDLTLKDLDLISQAFLRVLSGFFHERIQYPEMNMKDDDIVIVEAGEEGQGRVDFDQKRNIS